MKNIYDLCFWNETQMQSAAVGPAPAQSLERHEVTVKIAKRFSYRGTMFECINYRDLWFARSDNMEANVVIAKPSWKELKQAMREQASNGKG